MPIGTQTPGSPTTVTPDSSPGIYTSTQGPAPDGPVVADDVLAVHQIALNIQDKAQEDMEGISSALSTAVNNIPGVGSSVTQYVDLCNGTTIIAAASSGFAKDQNYGRVSWVQSAGLVDGDGIAFCISPLLPRSGRISLLRAYCRGNGHSSLPAQLPWVQLCRLDRNSTASTDMTVIGTGVDASANATAFDLVHYIDCTQNLPHTLDHGYEYHVRLRGEFGANAQIGFRFSSLEIGIVP